MYSYDINSGRELEAEKLRIEELSEAFSDQSREMETLDLKLAVSVALSMVIGGEI